MNPGMCGRCRVGMCLGLQPPAHDLLIGCGLLWYPLGGRSAGLPCLGDAAALLAQDLRVVGELVLERKLVAGVLPGVVEFGSPYGERAS
jgi:hypothetical protein